MKNSKLQSGGGWITAVLALAAVLYGLLAFLPGKKSIDRLRGDLAARQQYIALADSLLPLLEETRAQLASAERRWHRWNQHAPSEAETSSVFEQIHARAKASGATPTRFDPLDGVEMQTLRRVPVAVGATGSFPQVFALVRNLEQLPQGVWIEELRLEVPRGAPAGETMLDARLVLFATKMEKIHPSSEATPILPVIRRVLIRSLLPDVR